MNAPDHELLAELGAALGVADPVPEWVSEGARAAFTWRTIDAELAELVFDSVETAEPAGVRGGTRPRELTFRSPELELELMVVGEDVRRLVGQLVPPQTATVSLIGPDLPERSVAADEMGRFGFDGAPEGPIRLRCSLADGAVITTDWMRL